MSGNIFGELYRFVTFGESHGHSVGVVIDGCPPGIGLTEEFINTWTLRRAPGQSVVTTPRNESDSPTILSGVFDGVTLGTPIAVTVKNKDHRSQDYQTLHKKFRPSHAEFTYLNKYHHMDWRGGGRASARETIGRVIAGAVAFRVLKTLCPELESSCYVKSVGEICMEMPPAVYSHEDIYSNNNCMRCPDPKIAETMKNKILEAKKEGDSIGSVIEFAIKNVPVGLGEPVFDKLTADISKALMSLPASRGVEIGVGFQAGTMKGSVHNDPFKAVDGHIRPATNNAGGVLGGMSSGELLYGRVAFKPPSTISLEQDSVDVDGNPVKVSGKEGRHDPCVASRAVPVVECMLACVILDHFLRNYHTLSAFKKSKD